MESRLKLIGHPVHPMMVNLPIGLYTASLIFDLVFLWTGGSMWYQMAFWLIVLGLAGNLGANATGIVDYFVIAKDPKAPAYRTVRVHLILGTTLLILYLINLILRWIGGIPPIEGTPWLPILLNLIGIGLLGLQGWYGGELVYRHKIGMIS